MGETPRKREGSPSKRGEPNLAELAARETASFIHSKIEATKNEKNIEALRNTYDDIINRLLSEREDAIRIAQVYKVELDRIYISDDDIRSLHKTIGDILEILKKYTDSDAIESIEQIKDLISVDTLKTIQLFGFNFKTAIGEPIRVTQKGKNQY